MEEETDEKEIREVMADILQDCRVVTLATEFDGRPWATTIFFGMKGSDLYCVVEDRGHGMANLKRNPNVAFAIDNGVPDRFVQGTGTAEVVDREEEDEGRKIVLDRVPEYKPFFEMTETSVVRITLREVLVTDVTREWFPAKSLSF